MVGVTTTIQLRESIIRAFHERSLSYEEIASLLGIGRAESGAQPDRTLVGLY